MCRKNPTINHPDQQGWVLSKDNIHTDVQDGAQVVREITKQTFPLSGLNQICPLAT